MHINEKWYLKGRKGDIGELAKQIGVSRRLASLLLTKLHEHGSYQPASARCAEPGAADGDNKPGAAGREDQPASAGSDEPQASAGGSGRSLADAAREFLSPDINLLHDGLLMKDMDRALAVLKEAATSRKRTLIIGDYDVDGIMGVLILSRVLKKAMDSVSHCIPHRVDDGYGINERIVRSAYEDGVELIITCDNGMSAHETVTLAKSLGIGVIVTDHHDVSAEGAGAGAGAGAGEGGTAGEVAPAETSGLPTADAVVNPKRPDCEYPFKDLCGAMVAYKLALAFAASMNIELPDCEIEEMLCYAAVATICDIVGLVDENRRVVYHGLKLLNAGVKNPGMAALINICGLTGRELTTYEVGHIIGPCVNAAGRLDTAELSFDLFMENDPVRVEKIASEIFELNRKRKDLTASAFERAVREIDREGMSLDSVITLCMPGAHESICGIVAGKLKDKYARPVIVFTDTASGLLKGSGRSVEGYDLLSCVKTAGDMLEKYGGHKMAVGITIAGENLPRLRDVLNRNCRIGEDMLIPKERVDLCLEPGDITIDLINEIACLAPFGRGNEKPVFALKDMTFEYASLIGARRNVIKLKMRRNAACPGDRPSYAGTLVEAVFFGDVSLFMNKLDLTAGEDGALVCRGKPAVAADVTFFPEINEYNGLRKVQLVIRSVRKAV